MRASSATTERSFSTMRRMVSWLRSSMKQKRLYYLAIISFHKFMIDEFNFVETENNFVSVHENRLNQFGKFTCDDEL